MLEFLWVIIHLIKYFLEIWPTRSYEIVVYFKKSLDLRTNVSRVSIVWVLNTKINWCIDSENMPSFNFENNNNRFSPENINFSKECWNFRFKEWLKIRNSKVHLIWPKSAQEIWIFFLFFRILFLTKGLYYCFLKAHTISHS